MRVLSSFLRVVFLVLPVLLAGCGNGFRVEELEVSEDQLKIEPHKYFTLLNSKAEKGPEWVHLDTEKAPMGAMVGFVRIGGGKAAVKQCTLTHIAPGILLSASHCVWEFQNNPTDLWAVFYDRKGILQSRRALSVQVADSPEKRDIAVIAIDKTDLEWDSWNANLSEFRDAASSIAKGVFEATIWALDPIPQDALPRQKGRLALGMKAVPKRCRGAQGVPQLRQRTETNLFTPDLIETEDLVQENFYYFDVCSRRWISGNSGALITIDGELSPIAVASAVYYWPKATGANGQSSTSDSYDFSGPSGIRTLSRKAYDKSPFPLFALGAAFVPNLTKSRPMAATALRFDVP